MTFSGEQKVPSSILTGSTDVDFPFRPDPVAKELHRLALEALDRETRVFAAEHKTPIDDALKHVSAMYVIRWSLDRIYNAIFASQLAFLEHLENHAAAAPVSKAQELWDRARELHPDLHKDRTFDQWLQFLTATGLIERTNEIVRLTKLGNLFLPYLRSTNQSLTGRIG